MKTILNVKIIIWIPLIFNLYEINSKSLWPSFFIDIRAHLADLDMSATDYDGRTSTKETVWSSIIIMATTRWRNCCFLFNQDIDHHRKDGAPPRCLWGSPCLRQVIQPCLKLSSERTWFQVPAWSLWSWGRTSGSLGSHPSLGRSDVLQVIQNFSLRFLFVLFCSMWVMFSRNDPS